MNYNIMINPSIVVYICAFFFIFADGKFVIMVVNDVHLDLTYDPFGSSKTLCQIGKSRENTFGLYGKIGCDGPFLLYKSTLDKMKEVNSKPDLILVPGDMVAHSVPRNDGVFDSRVYRLIKSVIANYTATIASVYPETPIVFVQGNDDYALNYHVPNRTHKIDYYMYVYSQIIKNIKANKICVSH